MSTIGDNGTNAALALQSASSGIAGKLGQSATLDQDDFLQLMITQLTNQDPTKPLDPTQFVSQLAQFSQVAGVQEMNTSLETLTNSLRGSTVLDGASLVGRDVLIESDHVRIAAGGTVTGSVDLPAQARNLTVEVRSASGELVRRMQVDVAAAGQFTWDGMQSNGTAAPAGTYTFDALVDVGGVAQSAPVMVADRVTSVSIDSTTYALTLNTSTGGPIGLADVRRVF